MSDPADLTNLAIEVLVQQRNYLPTFGTLDRLVNHVHEQIHQQLYTQINARPADGHTATAARGSVGCSNGRLPIAL